MTWRLVTRYLWRLDTAASVMTLIAMALLTERNRWGWVVALANQGFWLALITRRRLWGLLPLTIIMTVIYSRGIVRWFWP